MECDRCGLPLLGTEVFCPQCGTRLGGEAAGQAERPAEEAAAPRAKGRSARARAKKAPQPDEVDVPLVPSDAAEVVDVPLEPAPELTAPSPESQPVSEEAAEFAVTEAADIPLEVPVVAEPAPARGRAAIQQSPRARRRPSAMLIGPLGLGIVVGCLFIFVLGLGAMGVYRGRQIRSERNKQQAIEHYERGIDHLQLGEYDLAAAEFEYALRLWPNYPEAEEKLQQALQSGRQPSPASPQAPEDSSALWAAGRAAYERGAWDEAIDRLQALQALDPNYEQAAVRRLLAGAYTNSGLKLVSEDRLEEAIRRFDQALAVEPDNPDAQLQSHLATLYQGGLTASGVEDWREAIKNLSAVYALKPDYKDVAERLPRTYVLAGDAAGGEAAWCDAVEYYKLALDLSSSPDVAARRDDAAHRCASAPEDPGHATVPSGTYVGTFTGFMDNRERTNEWAEVRGHVLDAEGRGVANAQVQLSAFDWTSNIHTSDDTGYYAIEFLANEITFTVTLVGVPVQPVDVPTKFGYASVVDFRAKP